MMTEETDYRTLIFNFPFYTFETWFNNLQALIDETKSKADLSEIERIAGKTDKTVISYLNSKQIQKLLDSEIVFDIFYNYVKIKKKEICLREAILLKSKY